MKSMQPNLAAIFFKTYFYRAGGGMFPSRPLDPLLGVAIWERLLSVALRHITLRSDKRVADRCVDFVLLVISD